MTNIIRKQIYHCADDCEIQGCPGHEAELNIQTCSDAYSFKGRGGKWKYFERHELQTFIDLLVSVDRADIVKIPIKPAP